MGEVKMRIEILFDEHNKPPSKMIEALRGEIEKKLTPLYPKFGLRIANSTSSLIQVTGTKNAAEHDEVISVIQSIWEDDSWIPA